MRAVADGRSEYRTELLAGLEALERTLDATKRLQARWRASRVLPGDEVRSLRRLMGELRSQRARVRRARGADEPAGQLDAASELLDKAIGVIAGIHRAYELERRKGQRARREQIELELHELERVRHRYAALVAR